MAASSKRYLTQHDLYHLPDDGQRHELVRGHVVSEPPTGYRHGRLASILSYEFENYSRRTGQGIAAVCEVGFCLSCDPDTVRAPDVAIIDTSRLGSFNDQRFFFPGAPDLAVDILSPSDRSGRIRAKIDDYLEAGTGTVWIVDPDKKNVQIWSAALSAEGDLATTINCSAGDVLTAPSLLPGFELPVSRLL